MSSRRRERRQERQARRAGRTVALNIVSLIDVFAILVFYLLVNALTVEVIPSPKALKLPESVVQEQPRPTLSLIVTTEEILVDNQSVMRTAQALGAGNRPLVPLRTALQRTPLQPPAEKDAAGGFTRGEVNILADKSIPFRLLKKVMATCSEARFAHISLAVIEKGSGGVP
jgi:biopolymer transport protein ExbD